MVWSGPDTLHFGALIAGSCAGSVACGALRTQPSTLHAWHVVHTECSCPGIRMAGYASMLVQRCNSRMAHVAGQASPAPGSFVGGRIWEHGTCKYDSSSGQACKHGRGRIG